MRPPEHSTVPAFEVVTTRTGHKAMLDHRTGEVMHPVVGPVREPRQLFVEPSLLADRLQIDGPPLRLLDVGLGAGSNAAAAWATALALPGRKRALEIVSFDRTLAALRLVCTDAHASAFAFEPQVLAAGRALSSGAADVPLAAGTWRVVVGELPLTLEGWADGSAEVVYWDPFSPRRNTEMWTIAAFAALRRCCAPAATLHTYSGATATRTAMLLAGFFVGYGERLGGNKRATMAATAMPLLREPLGSDFLLRLSRSSAPFPSDACGVEFERLREHPQFLVGQCRDQKALDRS